MARVHRATLSPGKAELVAAWAGRQSWWTAPPELVARMSRVGSYRFDDPDGEVGIETLLLAAGSAVVQVPLTYRGAPLPGAEAGLVGEADHSVLGRRWVYDGCTDPVYVRAVATAALAGGRHADEEIEVDGVVRSREALTQVRGSGLIGTAVPTFETVTAGESRERCSVVTAGALTVTVCRIVGSPVDVTHAHTLTGIWPNHSDPQLLAVVR